MYLKISDKLKLIYIWPGLSHQNSKYEPTTLNFKCLTQETCTVGLGYTVWQRRQKKGSPTFALRPKEKN